MTTRIGCATLFAAALLVAQPRPSYHVTHTYSLGGGGSWDYVVPDPSNHRLFIARQNRVMVVDEDKGTLLGEVVGINGAHGTTLAGSSGHGFATAGNDQAVIMFDAKTFKNLKRIPAAEDADAIIYDAPSDRVFTFNGDAHSSTVIDSGGNLVTNIQLGASRNMALRRETENFTRISRTRARSSKSIPKLPKSPAAGPLPGASSLCRWQSIRGINGFLAAAEAGLWPSRTIRSGE